jgi:hypothetical protein
MAAIVPSRGASRATYGVTIGITGTVTVALGLVLAPTVPVLSSVLVGVPAGLAGWMTLRAATTRAVCWPPAPSGRRASDHDSGDHAQTGTGAAANVRSEP